MKQLYQFDSFLIDVRNRTLLKDGIPVQLKPKVFDTLLLLVEGKGNLLEKDRLINVLWGDTVVEENNLTQNISALRKVLGETPKGDSYIETLPKRGYRFRADIREIEEEDDALIVETHRRSHIVIEQKRAEPEEKVLPTAEAADGKSAQAALPAALSRGSRWRQLSRVQVGVGLALVVLLGAAAVALRLLPGSPSQPEEDWRRTLEPTPVLAFKKKDQDVIKSARFNHDGVFIAYSLFKGGDKEEIWVTTLGGETHRQITKDEFKNFSPVWLPAKHEIAYLSVRNGQVGIWKVSLISDTPTLVRHLQEFQEPGNPNLPDLIKWSKDKEKVYLTWKRNLYALELTAGQLTQLTNFDPNKSQASGFEVSFQEDWVSYIDIVDGQVDIWKMPVAGGEAVRVTDNRETERRAFWHPDGGRVIYKSSSAQGVNQICSADVETRKITQIKFDNDEGQICDVSPDGTKFLYLGIADDSDLWKVEEATGKEEQLTSDIGVEFWPQISPDSKSVAYQFIKGSHIRMSPPTSRLLVKQMAPASPAQEVAAPGYLPQWSPDGKTLAFVQRENGEENLWIIDPVTMEKRQITTESIYAGDRLLFPFNKVSATDYSFSPDGTKIAYRSRKDRICNIHVVSQDNSNDTPITDSADPNLTLRSPIWSPNGKKLAYVSDKLLAPGISQVEWRLSVYDEGKVINYLSTPENVRLLGWLNNNELLIATVLNEKGNQFSATEVTLRAVSVSESRELAKLEKTYLTNIHLAADGKSVAFVSTRDGNYNIFLLAIGSKAAQQLTGNRDAQVFLSSLAWSPDGKFIVYGRQNREYQLTLMNNFR